MVGGLCELQAGFDQSFSSFFCILFRCPPLHVYFVLELAFLCHVAQFQWRYSLLTVYSFGDQSPPQESTHILEGLLCSLGKFSN